jgi:hypothetical protein
MPAPTVFKNTAAADLSFGITDETGIIVTSFSRNVSSVKTEVRNASNDVCAVAYSGMTAEITVDGFSNGDNDLTVASAVTLTNTTTTSGLTGGTVLVNSVNESSGQGEFRKVSASMTQYAETLVAS